MEKYYHSQCHIVFIPVDNNYLPFSVMRDFQMIEMKPEDIAVLSGYNDKCTFLVTDRILNTWERLFES